MNRLVSFSSLSNVVAITLVKLSPNKMKIVIMLICTLVGLTLGSPEKPGPYPAKGWKPQGARLELPDKYGPPREQRAKPDEIEITTPTSDYQPTSTENRGDGNDVLRVQGLPAVDAVSQFNNSQQKKSSTVNAQQPTARIQLAPAPAFIAQPFLLSPLFAPQFAPVSGQLQERQFGQQKQVQEFDNPKSDAQQLPAQAYGPPQINNNGPVARQPQPEIPQNEEPEQTQDDNNNEEEEDDQEDSGEPALAVANAAGPTGNLVQETQQGQIGQYYILLPDNSLQKVRFATKQTVEDREIDGFSAQLR